MYTQLHPMEQLLRSIKPLTEHTAYDYVPKVAHSKEWDWGERGWICNFLIKGLGWMVELKWGEGVAYQGLRWLWEVKRCKLKTERNEKESKMKRLAQNSFSSSGKDPTSPIPPPICWIQKETNFGWKFNDSKRGCIYEETGELSEEDEENEEQKIGSG